jgi:DsbC/DsbD-like thiol-disulfide interchange protein
MVSQLVPTHAGRRPFLEWIVITGIGGLVAIAAARANYAQSGQPIVNAKMVLATQAVHPGSTIHAAVIAQIAPGYHINDHHPTLKYLIPTEVKFEPDKNFAAQKISYPKGKLEKFTFAENGLSVYQGRLVIPALLRAAPGVRPGRYTLSGQVNYQACNASACFPPASATFSLPVRVVRPKVPVRSAKARE